MAPRGIEEQTRKLFEVCRLRNVPIITFVNELDREGRDPFDLPDGSSSRCRSTCPRPPADRHYGVTSSISGVKRRKSASLKVSNRRSPCASMVATTLASWT